MIRALPIVLLCCTALAQSAPRLLVDVNTEPVAPSSSNPDDFARFGAWVFFSADDGVHGRELFRTNGVAATTGLFADLRPGPDGSDPRDLVQVGTRLFFTADDGVHGRELWISDGTPAGSRMLDEIVPGANRDLWLGHVVAAGTRLILARGTELWSVDSQNPVLIQLVSSTQNPWPIASAVPMRDVTGEFALLLVGDLHHGGIWRTDGTAAGTSPVFGRAEWAMPQLGTVHLISLESFALVTNHTSQRPSAVWITDGTLNGTRTTGISPRGTIDLRSAQSVEFDGLTWIVGIGGDFAWVSDGTAQGTRAVASPWPGAAGVARVVIGVVGRSLYLIGWDGAFERLLRVDAGSTTPIDVGPLPALVDLGVASMTMLGVRAIGVAGSDSLIAFDPANNSAQLLDTVGAGARTMQPFVAFGRAFYRTAEPGFGNEIGITDGTFAGTGRLADLNTQIPATAGIEASTYGRFGGRGIIGARWWTTNPPVRVAATFITDGTPGGTHPIADQMYEGIGTEAGGRFWFTTNDGAALWSSDGTVVGSMRMPPPPAVILALTGVGDALIAFVMGRSGIEVHRIDGGVRWNLLATLPPARVYTPVRVGDRVCVRFTDVNRATGLFMTDGTATGTAHVVTGNATEYEDVLVAFGDRVWFAETTASAGTALWSSDGTVAGTRQEFQLSPWPVHSMRATASKLFVRVGFSVFTTDGTEGGTVLLSNQASFLNSAGVEPFAVVGQSVLFDAYASGGTRPFVSDGTIVGTMPLDVRLDRARSADEYVSAGDGRVLFDALDTRVGRYRSYVTDGTPAGTRLHSDTPLLLRTRPPRWRQLEFSTAGGRIYLTRTDSRAGLEPHVIDLGATVERLSEGCGVGARRAELYATLGGSPVGGLSIEGRSSIGSVAQIVLSAPPMHPLAFPQNGACTLDVDPNAWVLLASLPIANQRFAQFWSLPDDPALYGLQAVVQGFVGPTNAPLGADFTNGLLLSLGQ